jgi:hypothetical protein
MFQNLDKVANLVKVNPQTRANVLNLVKVRKTHLAKVRTQPVPFSCADQ